jgi:hypothetical protein
VKEIHNVDLNQLAEQEVSSSEQKEATSNSEAASSIDKQQDIEAN